ncbi:alpha/beta fold hydrolase [Roseomonas rosulenta]|uniref:alpha/beta fold hydrolase n=1 Tax=Roseomonas rosulenta TaxID=2748667 RepID=UPI0018DF1E83|nr:alpha/beta fold hydrolase [Roseomonas rosulenta]
MAGWPDGAAWAPFVARWQAACQADAVLAEWRAGASTRFAIANGVARAEFTFGDAPDSPDFALEAPPHIWALHLQPVPPRHHHAIFAMRHRVPEFRITGEEIAFLRHCHLVRRVLEVGRWLVLQGDGPVPAFPRPSLPAMPAPDVSGRYIDVTAEGRGWRLYAESAGQGRDILCLHTAGADGRQFHGLMSDKRLTDRWRLTSFDMPWHGKSPPPAEPPGAWRLTTDRYVELIMGVVAAAGLHKPVLLGASMSGEICLEVALRHPDAFSAIIACEACDHVPGRRSPWAADTRINQAIFVPEWIHGLMAPQSPAECAAQIWWHYSQGGFATFDRDIRFYSGEWDARDRVHRIDTSRCPLVMLTGEYDYSCTAEMSEATAAKIPGARFTRMNGIGHFPFAENPPLFLDYLLPVLDGL